jgi:two-component system nitrogen regulation sensor histidine kinase NtrY
VNDTRARVKWPAWLAASGLVALAVALTLALAERFSHPAWAGAIVLAIVLPVSVYVLQRQLAPVPAIFCALAGTVTSYRSGDFSFSLAWPRRDELGEPVAAHNALGDTLREQRLGLVQRELLLDTMCARGKRSSASSSHELNNSLGPIASLAESGSDLIRLGEHARLERVFDTIAERAATSRVSSRATLALPSCRRRDPRALRGPTSSNACAARPDSH